MKKIALILCLVLVASFVLSGCNNSDSIITLEDREVGKIEIQSGNTGETVEVTEEEVISQIADILSLEFEKGEKSNDSTGWSYSVRWYDTEGKQIDTVVIMNDGTIEKDGYFWKTSKDNIELSVFDELVTKHSSELPLEWDKIPMVMVDGKLYYDTGKESTVSARCGVMDGEITSTVDGSEIPTKDNQSNFGTGFEYQYGADNTIEIFMNEKWIVFEQREGDGSKVRYGDRMVDAEDLSKETLEWLDWYNSLPEEQQVLFEKIAERTRNIVTVVIAGRPLDLRRISEKSKAVIMAWRPGTMGAEAVVDIVYGRTNPSGKLAVSIPWCVGQVPVSYWDIKTGHIYDADHPENRFSSRYMDIPNTPLYPFGFGLSYTEFNISDIEVQAGPDKRVHVHCKVSNTGKVAGAEVVQCYYETLCSSVVRPRKELVRFQRVFLEPGEKKTVDFSIDREEFSYYDENMEIVCSQMKLRISIGNSSDHEWGNSVIFV